MNNEKIFVVGMICIGIGNILLYLNRVSKGKHQIEQDPINNAINAVIQTLFVFAYYYVFLAL